MEEVETWGIVERYAPLAVDELERDEDMRRALEEFRLLLLDRNTSIGDIEWSIRALLEMGAVAGGHMMLQRTIEQVGKEVALRLI